MCPYQIDEEGTLQVLLVPSHLALYTKKGRQRESGKIATAPFASLQGRHQRTDKIVKAPFEDPRHKRFFDSTMRDFQKLWI
jgi:hypothetical protein